MGALYKVSCECGFTEQVTVGGSRASFSRRNMHPYFCEKCGLIECNIAHQRPNPDLPICCGNCKSENILPYGTNLLNRCKEKRHKFPEISFYMKDNLCPVCRNYSLNFSTIVRYS